MPPKKHSQSQVASQSQISVQAHSSDEEDGDDNGPLFEHDPQFKQMVCASVQYILIHSSKSHLIKRLEWINTVLRPMAVDGRKYFPKVHKFVVKGLQETFGYKLIYHEKQDGEILFRLAHAVSSR